MKKAKVSVIIPTYGGADYLGDAIQSVLQQTFQDFELIVVNDASPDHTDEIVGRFKDDRLRYIKHEQNRGVAHARKTGVLQSCGAIIAHLDQDDFFHPEKLQIHVDYLDQNPEIGFTYNSRFELYPTSGAIREILRPSPELNLADFVLGFPLAPSVWVQRREWILREEIWEEKTFHRGREIVVCGRLYMAGCKFAMIDRVLNYRRYHRNRVVKNVARQCEAERVCQQIVFDDPRFPTELLPLKDVASSNVYSMWAYVAYLQNEIDLGRDLLAEAIRLNPALLDGTPPAIVTDLIIDSIDDEHVHHQEVLKRMFEHLPPEVASLSEYHSWAVTRGYLMQGIRAVIWNRLSDAQEYFSHVENPKGQLDEALLQWITSHLLSYEKEFGLSAVFTVLENLSGSLNDLGIPNVDRTLKGHYYANQAFENFRQKDYYATRASVLRAILNSPGQLGNRGLLSVFMRSMPLLKRGEN